MRCDREVPHERFRGFADLLRHRLGCHAEPRRDPFQPVVVQVRRSDVELAISSLEGRGDSIETCHLLVVESVQVLGTDIGYPGRCRLAAVREEIDPGDIPRLLGRTDEWRPSFEEAGGGLGRLLLDIAFRRVCVDHDRDEVAKNARQLFPASLRTGTRRAASSACRARSSRRSTITTATSRPLHSAMKFGIHVCTQPSPHHIPVTTTEATSNTPKPRYTLVVRNHVLGFSKACSRCMGPACSASRTAYCEDDGGRPLLSRCPHAREPAWLNRRRTRIVS